MFGAEPERIVALFALAWMIASIAMLSATIGRGRRLADALAQRHPALYEELGRPRPGYLDSLQRSRFARYVGQREYETLPDPPLVAEFDAHRRAEARTLFGMLSSLCIVFLALSWVRWAC